MQKWVYTFFCQNANMIATKVNYNKSYIFLFFGKKPSETAISPERKMKKTRTKVFLNVHLIRNLLVHIEKANSKK